MGGKPSKSNGDNKPLVEPAYFPYLGTKKSSSNNHSRPPSEYDSINDDWPWVWGIRDSSLLDWKIGLTNDEIQQRSKLQRDLPVEIMEGLYLGSAQSVQNVFLLESLGITAVLNMAGPIALKNETVSELEDRGISYKQINAEDELFYPLLEKHWKEAHEFIQSATADGKGKCVVHCVAGINRSGLIAAAYYMNKMQTPVLDTVKHIRIQRGNMALNNEGFQQQLVAMARLNSLLGTKPGDQGCIIKEQPPPAPDGEWVFAPLNKKSNPLDRLTF